MTKKRDQPSALHPVGTLAGGRELTSALIAQSDGNIRVELRRLPTPQNTYDADYAWVRRSNGSIDLYFAKQDDDVKERLASRVQVRYSPEAFVGTLWHNSREFHEGLRERYGKPQPRETDVTKMPAARSTSMWVTVEVMAQSGGHAALSFYLVEPTGVAFFARNRDTSRLDVEPMLRVFIPTIELVRLLDEADLVARELSRKDLEAVAR